MFGWRRRAWVLASWAKRETFLRLMFTSDDPFLEGKKALWQAELERDSPFARDFAETYCGLNVYPGRLA